jgi:hypothetical protein
MGAYDNPPNAQAFGREAIRPRMRRFDQPGAAAFRQFSSRLLMSIKFPRLDLVQQCVYRPTLIFLQEGRAQRSDQIHPGAIWK